MKRTPKKKKVFRFAAAVVTFAALVMWSGCEGANKPGGSSQTGNSDGGNSTIVNNGGSGGGNTGGVTPPSASADQTYTVGGVSFTMKGIAAVTNGTVGHEGENDNKPHKVSLSAYWIGETEVTQELWKAVMGNNPSEFNGSSGKEPAAREVQGKRPVETINWYHAIAFCNKLSLKLGLEPCYTVTVAGSPVNFETLTFDNIPTSDDSDWNSTVLDMNKKGFRLPTEAEWEWAAKGGTEYKWAGTDTKDELKNYAWYGVNSDSKTHEVKKKLPNGYGLYDMSGNVWEWCWNWNENSPAGGQDPTGPTAGSDRVGRGGSWKDDAGNAACAYRLFNPSDLEDYNLGLRLACRP